MILIVDIFFYHTLHSENSNWPRSFPGLPMFFNVTREKLVFTFNVEKKTWEGARPRLHLIIRKLEK